MYKYTNNMKYVCSMLLASSGWELKVRVSCIHFLLILLMQFVFHDLKSSQEYILLCLEVNICRVLVYEKSLPIDICRFRYNDVDVLPRSGWTVILLWHRWKKLFLFKILSLFHHQNTLAMKLWSIILSHLRTRVWVGVLPILLWRTE